MRINKIRLEVREVVLCANIKKVDDFNELTVPQQLSEIHKSSPKRIANFFRVLKNKNEEVVRLMLKKNPTLILSIKKPTVPQVSSVLDTHPAALNKLPSSKRTEDLVIKAIRPVKKVLHGPRDIRAKETIKNVSALCPKTTFTPRVYHEIVRLLVGADPKTVKKLVATLDKQKRKLPDTYFKMLGTLKGKALSSEEVMADTEISTESKSIVRVTNFPYTITVVYPKNDFRYEYYIGDPKEFNELLRLKYNPGEFSKRVREKGYSVKKLKLLSED